MSVIKTVQLYEYTSKNIVKQNNASINLAFYKIETIIVQLWLE